MNEGLKDLLGRRRDRCLARILNAKDEFEADRYDGREFRKVILDEFNDFYNMALDVIKSIDDESVVVNRDFYDRVERIYDAIGHDHSWGE